MVPENGILYHYTSIETLACILKNKTIRFTPLDKLDDLQEQETSDGNALTHYFYASCWTDTDEESIPMWRMYTPKNSGVRIALPAMPFKKYHPTLEELWSCIEGRIRYRHKEPPVATLRPFHDESLNDTLTLLLDTENDDGFLVKVKYDNDRTYLYPNINVQGEPGTIDISNIGRVKNTYWEFQHEWRYLFAAIKLFNVSKNAEWEVTRIDAINALTEAAESDKRRPFESYDLTLDDNAFKEMRITLCPDISYGNRIIVKTLVSEFNPDAIIAESSLRGLVR